MEKVSDYFELDFEEGKIQVHRLLVGTQTIFRILFSDKRPPLVVTRATHANAYKFWTSIPEGRQTEAEEVGVLISEYYYKLIP
jgi:hypothetical protein